MIQGQNKRNVFRIARHLAKFIILVLLVVSIMLATVPPKPTQAFAIAIVPAVVIGVGMMLATAGIVYANQGDLEVGVKNTWDNLSGSAKTYLYDKFTTAQQTYTGSCVIARYIWDEVATNITNLWAVDPASNSGITSQSQEVCFNNGDETFKASSDSYYNYDQPSYVYPKADATYFRDFLEGSDNMQIEIGAFGSRILMTLRQGGQLQFDIGTSYGTGQSFIDYNINKPIVKDYGTYKGLTMTGFIRRSPTYLSGNFSYTPSAVGIKDNNGFSRTGAIGYNTTYHRITVTQNSIAYPIGQDYQFESIPHFVYEMIYNNLTIPYTQHSDYIPNYGAKSIDNVLGEEEDLDIVVPQAVADVVGANPADTLVDTYVDVEVTAPTGVPSTDNPDVENLKLPVVLLNKFPFCIPFDLAKSFSYLQQKPEVPKWEIPLVITSLDLNYKFIIDLAPFQGIVTMARWFLLLGFVIGLIMATRGLIKG
jgi:hypothetical protein